MARILILEDHDDCNVIFKELLSPNHEVNIVRSLAELHKWQSRKKEVDLFIADLYLPDGFLLDEVKNRKLDILNKVPTIIVSSSEDMNVLTTCFEFGAADYLIKPFRPNDLRVKTAKALGAFNTTSQEDIADILEELTLIEGKIFRVLHEKQNEFLTREQCIPLVWKKVSVLPKTFDVHLSNVRKKISHTRWNIEHEENRGWKLTRS